MALIVELAEAPIDPGNGMPVWSEELDEKVSPELVAREIVAVTFPLNGQRTIGMVASRVVQGEFRSWRLRMLALAEFDTRVVLSAWASWDDEERPLSPGEHGIHPPGSAQFGGVFGSPGEARRAVEAWALEVGRPSSQGEADVAQRGGADRPTGMLSERDVEDFLREIGNATMRGKDEGRFG
jgi:hypothetical protein